LLTLEEEEREEEERGGMETGLLAAAGKRDKRSARLARGRVGTRWIRVCVCFVGA
jgi:hypothetical protein